LKASPWAKNWHRQEDVSAGQLSGAGQPHDPGNPIGVEPSGQAGKLLHSHVLGAITQMSFCDAA
jgi:hypothetical protein